MDTLQTQTENWLTNNQGTIVGIICIIVAAFIITFFGERIIKRAVDRAVHSRMHSTKEEEEKRERTVAHIISRVMKIAVWPLAVMSIVAQLGVDIAPLIAGAGIIGLAVGFGAQTMVKDMISGLFIISENQYAVGDVVDLDGTSGLVQDITLRKTVLRDLDGIVHHIPNGSITVASNYSSEFSGINLDVGVSYDANLEEVIKVINRVGISLLEDDDFKSLIIEQPKFLRVDDFADSAVVVKITGRVKPLAQWEVTGEYRKRLKVAFDKAGIEIPFPQRVVHQAKK